MILTQAKDNQALIFIMTCGELKLYSQVKSGLGRWEPGTVSGSRDRVRMMPVGTGQSQQAERSDWGMLFKPWIKLNLGFKDTPGHFSYVRNTFSLLVNPE